MVFLEEINYTPEVGFADANTEAAHLLGCVQQKVTMHARLRLQTVIFTNDNETIQLGSSLFPTVDYMTDNEFLGRFQNYYVGDSIKISGTANNESNDGTYTITEKIDDNTIRVGTVFPNGTEALGSGGVIRRVMVTTQIIYDYGVVENSSGISYLNPLTGEIQRYSANVGALNTWVTMTKLGSQANFWNGESARVRITTNDTTNEIDVFEIEHTFLIAPFYLPNQFTDFVNGLISSPLFAALNSPKHVFRFSGLRDQQNPNAAEVGQISNILGNCGWWDENLNGFVPNFTLGSVEFKNSSAVVIPKPLLTTAENTTVEGTLDAVVSNSFISEGESISKFVVNFFVLPENFTLNESATENYLFDRCVATINAAAANGEEGILKAVDFDYNTGEIVDFTFELEFTSAQVAKINALGAKYCHISIYTATPTSDFQQSDVVNVRVYLGEFDELIPDPTSTTIRNVRHSTNDVANQINYGETHPLQESVTSALILIDTDIDNSRPTFFTHELLVRNASGDEVILDTKTWNLAGLPIVNGVPFAQFTEPSLLRSAPTEIRNKIILQRETSSDSGTERAYRILYPWMFRYEEWALLILQAQAAFGFDTSLPFNGINNDWYKWATLTGVDFYVRVSTGIQSDIGSAIFSQEVELTPLNFGGQAAFSDGVITIRELDGTNLGFIPNNRNTLVRFTSTRLFAFSTFACFHAYIKESGEFFQLSTASTINNRDLISNNFLFDASGNFSSPTYTAECKIDFTKLPIANEMTIFATLGRVTGAMNEGTIFENFLVSNIRPDALTPPVLEAPYKACCYVPTVFADRIDSADLKNDKTPFYKKFPQNVTTLVIDLQKKEGGIWGDVETNLGTSNFGTKLDLGFQAREGLKYAGYILNWRAVLEDHDEGIYRLTFNDIPTEEYCLQSYNSVLVDGSVRIDFVQNSLIGDVNQQLTQDFSGMNLIGQIRLTDSFFGSARWVNKQEKNRYENGREVDFVNELKEAYTLEIRQIPSMLLRWLAVNVFQADVIKITDYNSMNPDTFVSHEVRLGGEIVPNSKVSQFTDVIITFEDRFDNRRKLLI